MTEEMQKIKFIYKICLILLFFSSTATSLPVNPYCNFPRTFKINKYDKSFGISKGELRLALKNAANMWNQGTKKFVLKEVYTGKADIEINMVYGEAFEFYNKAQKLMSKGMQITADIKEFNRMQKNFSADARRLKTESEELNSKLNRLNSDIAAWNKSRNKSQLRLNQLKSEQERIKNSIKQFRIREKDFQRNTKFMRDWFNLIDLKNVEYQKQSKLLKQLQRGTLDYSLAGLYERFKGNETISLFLFSNRQDLTNVLAHEFGHALGVKHVNEERALMYKFANEKNKKVKQISVSDYLAFANICK